jgi:predicted PurR-regulated permease PerM
MIFLLPLVLFLSLAGSLLIAVACGAIFAIALEPLCAWLGGRLGRFRSAAPGLVVVLALSVVALPVALCVAFGRGDLNTLSARLGELQKASVLRGMSAETTKMVNRLGVPIKPGAVLTGMQHAVDVMTEWLVELSRASVRGTADALLSFFLFLLVFYACLRDHERLQAIVVRLLPLQPGPALRLACMVRDSSVDAVLGACLVGLLQAGMLVVSLSLLQVPGAWLLGIVAFFLSFLPILGTVPVTGFAVVYLFLQHDPLAGVIMIGCGCVVGVSDNALRLFIRPRGSTPALVNFVAIIGGLELIGLAGLFIGPVIAGAATWGVREIVRYRSAHVRRMPTPLRLEPPRQLTPPRQGPSPAVSGRAPARTPRSWRR